MKKRTSFLVVLLACTQASAHPPSPSGTETVLYSFTGATDGGEPRGTLIMGQGGSLFGTTLRGGALGYCNSAGCGTVFMLSPPSSGQTAWTYSVLYSFTNGTDGAAPMAGLVVDALGNLYGTTTKGGGTGCGGYGCGVVFEVSPPAKAGGAWSFATLHDFGGTAATPADGARPEAELKIDANGNLLGCTTQGGANNQGTVFRLVAPAAGSSAWTQQILHRFTGGTDGGHCGGPVSVDASGNLFGTTVYGGSTGAGVVFELTPPASGQTAWPEQVLYNLPGGANGGYPRGALVFDNAGNLYGTATNTAFELSPQAGGSWAPTILQAFISFADANITFAGLAPVVYPQTFAFYGTGGYGTTARVGAVYKLAAPNASNPSWNESLLYAFTGGADGANPFGGVVPGPGGVFYGATTFGGILTGCDIGCGVIYQVTP